MPSRSRRETRLLLLLLLLAVVPDTTNFRLLPAVRFVSAQGEEGGVEEGTGIDITSWNQCSETGISMCLTEDRICLFVNTTTTTTAEEITSEQQQQQQEICGPCRLGFVEIPQQPLPPPGEDFVLEETEDVWDPTAASASTSISSSTEASSSETTICVDITTLTVAMFAERFQPDYSTTTTNSTALLQQRQERLEQVAELVSELNLQSAQEEQQQQPTSTTTTDTTDTTPPPVSWGTSSQIVTEWALNAYAADTPEEQATRTGVIERPNDYDPNLEETTLELPEGVVSVPPVVNWVQRGAVSPVQQQGKQKTKH